MREGFNTSKLGEGVLSRGLAAYAFNVSFGHPKHCFFDSKDTQKFMSEFADDDFS